MVHRKHHPPRRGIMLVWLVLALAAIISMVALALDGGRMLAERQHVQATADAAALAAAGVLFQEYATNGGLDSQGNARAAALKMATANGITNGTNNAVVTVNIPPTQGDFVGTPGYAEVIISNRITTSFSVIFRLSQLSISARAVARGIMTGQLSGIYALAPSGGDGLHVHDQTIVNVVNAPVYVNSNGSPAFHVDNGGSITASTINVVGSSSYPAGGVNGTFKPLTSPVPDPLAGLLAPDPTGVTVRSNTTLTVTGSTTTQTISPGVYIGGIKVQNGATLIMQPGVYIIQGGGFPVQSATVQGTGVMIYNTGTNSQPAGTGAINFDQNSTITLSPPTTGTYAGISIFQDRASNQNVVIAPNGKKNITGVIYARAATVQVQGQSPNTPVDTVGSVIIANQLNFEHGNIKIDNTINPRPATSLYGLVD
jgi:Flp pilus assembly protein TadG